MQNHPRFSLKSYNTKFFLILLIFAGVLFSNLGGWDLWTPDEPRYAQIAREMMQTENYILPQLNGRTYSDKPPVYFWLISLSSLPFEDVTAFPARFPAALFALGMVLLTYLFGKRLFNPLTGILAAVILFTNIKFFSSATTVQLDTVLGFFVTLSLWFFYNSLSSSGGADRRLILFAYMFSGLAVLTKGPVGLIIPVLTVYAYTYITGGLNGIKRVLPVKGLIVTLGVVCLWLVPACLSGGEVYYRDILFRQNLGRVVSSFSHSKPFYFYLINFPVDFFPWSLFIPAAAICFWKTKRKDIWFPLVWFAATFIFFSLMSGKRNLYLIPCYPAAALLIGAFFDQMIRREKCFVNMNWLRVPALFFATVFTVMPVVVFFIFKDRYANPMQVIPSDMMTLFILTPLIFGSGVYGIISILKKKHSTPASFFAYSSTGMIICFAAVLFFVFPALNSYTSGRAFCNRIENRVNRDDLLYATFNPEIFNYYINRNPIHVIEDLEHIREIMLSSETVYIIIREKDYKKVSEDIKKGFSLLEFGDIKGRGYCLVVNKKTITQ